MPIPAASTPEPFSAAARETFGAQSLSESGRTTPKSGFRCPRCGAEWTALTAAHCAACHRTFSAPSLFDRHRDTRAGEMGSCRDPAEMTGIEFRDGMWRGPERDPEERARLARLQPSREDPTT